MRYFKILFALLSFLMILNSGCRQEKQPNLEVDLSAVPIPDIQINRYGYSLFSIPTDSFADGLRKMGPSFPIFLNNMHNTEQAEIQLRKFVEDKGNRAAWQVIKEKYKSVQSLQNELNIAFQHYSYYFPNALLPTVYTYISGYNYEHPVIIDNNNMLIGLDCFLGSDFSFYKNVRVPIFLLPAMDSQNIAPVCMHQMAEVNYGQPLASNDLINNMLETGKMLYFCEAMLPTLPKYRLFGFTEKQMEWCFENEKNLWALFIDEKLLFTKDATIIRRFINPAPFTSGIARSSPGQTGVFIGWQIIRAYMENNPAVTLSDLMNTNDYNKILQASRYKPAR